MRDPYSVLGVKRDAGADEIKAAWRTKAKSVHPDQNRDDPSATDRFAEIGQAYDVLKDPSKRTRYDQLKSHADAKQREQTIMQQREAAREAAIRAKAAKANAERVMAELARAEAEKAKADQANPAAAAQAKQAAADEKARRAAAAAAAAPQDAGGEPADDMISRIFGASAQASPAAEALRREAEARKGEQTDADGTAGGTEEDGAKAAPAKPIAAFEILTSLVRRIRGIQPLPEKAPDTAVEATITIEDLIKKNSITVTLPEGRDIRFALEPGHSDGHVVRLKEYGLKFQGMQRGDVVVTLRVARTERFSVDGVDIHTVLPVTLEDAVLGCDTTVETPTGTAAITIPPWSGSDRTIRIDDEGLHDLEGGRGALVVELRVMLWAQPDDKVTDLMRVMRGGLFL